MKEVLLHLLVAVVVAVLVRGAFNIQASVFYKILTNRDDPLIIPIKEPEIILNVTYIMSAVATVSTSGAMRTGAAIVFVLSFSLNIVYLTFLAFKSAKHRRD